MRETEIKYMLDEQVYLNIEKLFDWDSIKEQENHYYTDSAGKLRKSGITFRVRTKDGTNKLQIKMHKSKNSSLQICDEYEYPIDTVPDKFSAGKVKELTGLDVEVLLLGSLKTYRHSCFYCDGVEICLDKNEFLDRTDFEIEVEYTDSIPQKLLDILEENGVTFTVPVSGKCSRFMKRFSQLVSGED